MNNSKQKPSQQPANNKELLRYAGLGTQLLVAIGLSVFIGLKADNWLRTSPLLACVLPLLVLFGIFYKLFKETSAKKKDE
ncbi:MAG TPA: AtpZ/AtpI family protein [Chitinophagaceae bacterium]|nr:AtpZ/AtpI family protein [Chitinophagaceae bacterium]